MTYVGVLQAIGYAHGGILFRSLLLQHFRPRLSGLLQLGKPDTLPPLDMVIHRPACNNQDADSQHEQKELDTVSHDSLLSV